MKYMIIDIGSNTVKYTAFSYKDKTLTEIGRATEAVKLISCIDEAGELSREGLERLIAALERFRRDAEERGCKEICAFATASLRRVRDPEKVINAVKERTGIEIKLLDGKTEARCALAGLLLSNKELPREGVMIDMGGGSTELHFFRDRSSTWLCSLPFGALSLKRDFHVGDTLGEKEEKDIFAFVRNALGSETPPEGSRLQTAALIGGTAKACGRLIEAFFGMKVKNAPVKKEVFDALFAIVRDPDEAQSQTIRELAPDRFEILPSGLAGYEALFDLLGTKEILLCRGGAREGYLSAVGGKECLAVREKKEKEKKVKKEERKAEDVKETDAKSLVFEGMISLRALFDAQRGPFNDRKIVKLLYAKERLEKKKSEYAFLCHRAEEFSFPIEVCPMEEIAKIAVGTSHGGAIAICTGRTLREIGEGDLPENGFFVAMEGIEDPYNLGYALRSVWAAGADGVLFLGKQRFGADGTVCRSSAGASERMPLYTAKPEKAVEIFRHAGYRIVCADQPNSKPMYDADLSRPLLLVVGGEKRGITGTLSEESDETVRIDYGRDFDAALSAASASAVLAFEVFRQNRKKI